jgi:hypothetical protein
MNLEDTRLSLDGYRIQVLERLKNCPDPRSARVLLAEVHAMLGATGLSPMAQQAFWQGLSTDLEVVAEESPRLLGKDGAVRLTAVILAARAEIAQRLSSHPS